MLEATLNSLDLEPKKTILRESELQLNLLAGNLPAVLFKTAPDGSIVYVNQKGIEYTGRTLVDLQQKGWIDLIHPSSHWNRLLTESVGYDTIPCPSSSASDAQIVGGQVLPPSEQSFRA
jgi:PAS domain-containing protein